MTAEAFAPIRVASIKRHFSEGTLKRAVTERLRPVTDPIEDWIADAVVKPKLDAFLKSDFNQSLEPLRLLALGVQSPRRPGSLEKIYAEMGKTRHHFTVDAKGVDDLGKLDNINVLLERHDLSQYDWVITVDDDVELPEHFTDALIGLSEYADLKIVGPAHRAHSYWSHDITRRQRGVLVRETNYAEVGPIIAFRREVYDMVFPFPSLRFGWGVDMIWPVVAAKRGYKTGIVDAAGLRHTNPIGATYDFWEATREAEEYMAPHGIRTGEHQLETFKTYRTAKG